MLRANLFSHEVGWCRARAPAAGPIPAPVRCHAGPIARFSVFALHDASLPVWRGPRNFSTLQNTETRICPGRCVAPRGRLRPALPCDSNLRAARAPPPLTPCPPRSPAAVCAWLALSGRPRWLSLQPAHVCSCSSRSAHHSSGRPARWRRPERARFHAGYITWP